MSDIPAEAIPVSDFQAAPQPPAGAIPVSEFQHQAPPPGAIPVDQFESQEQAFGGTGNAIKAGLQGALEGAIGPLGPLAERAAGVSPETIRGLKAQHPIAHGVGEAATLVGGALTGTGEAALLSKAGEAAAGAAGLAEPVSYAAKVGSSALKQAVEMAVYQSGDEASKMILQDPDASAQNAIAGVGLAAALGGAGGAFFTGAVSPLWKATVGPKIDTALKAMTSKLGGIEGAAATSAASDLEKQSGVEIAPEFKSVLDDKPGARESHSILSQDDSSITGKKYQKSLQDQTDRTAARVVEALGRDPSSIENLPELDKYATGRGMGETLKSELEPVVKEISNRYDKTTEEFKNSLLTEENRRAIADQITQKSLERGWSKAESDAESKLATRVMEKMGSQETAEDLKKFITNLRDAHPYGSPTYQASKDIQKILRENQERVITENILRTAKPGAEEMAQQKLAEYGALKGDYAKLMDTIDSLNEHLHVGRYDGPKGFMQALGELSTSNGEGVLNRLSGKNKAGVLEVLQQFPETLNKVKQFHVDQLLDQSVKKAKPGSSLNINNLISSIDKMSPQVKGLIASPEQHQAIEAAGKILEGLKDPTHNFSNTARTMSKLMHSTPSALSLLAMLTGHGEAGILSYLGKMGFTEGRAAVKLALMKFLSSDQPVKAEGFKSLVSFVRAAQKGAETVDKASQAVFKPGVRVLVDSQLPSEAELTHLDKLVARRQDNHNETMVASQSGTLGHYAVEHQVAMSAASTRSLQYLQSLKPQPHQLSPLDKPVPPSKEQDARYHRALEIAQQPAVVLQRVKDGSIQPSDLQDLQAMHPAVYQQMAQKLTNEMVNSRGNEEPIPYRTRMGISLFLGQPMDSTMAPASIMAAQPQPKPQPQQQAQGKARRGTASLGKSNKQSMTPGQAAESDRSNRD